MDIDDRKKETIAFQDKMLHYGIYEPQLGRGLKEVPWHWHDEFEFGQVCTGSVCYRTNGHAFLLHAGDGIFINSGVLHSLQLEQPDCSFQTQFFDKYFLAGQSGSIFDIRYIAPVQDQKLLDAMPLYWKDAGSRPFLESLQQASEIGMRRGPFYELHIRNIFSSLWETVYHWAMQKQGDGSGYKPLEDERIKKMMTCASDNYDKKLTAARLAQEIHVSERECYRLFRSILGITPGEFILSLRLQKAQELLRSTDKSILEIALEAGFGTSSYFCKVFHAYHHITPNQYRKL